MTPTTHKTPLVVVLFLPSPICSIERLIPVLLLERVRPILSMTWEVVVVNESELGIDHSHAHEVTRCHINLSMTTQARPLYYLLALPPPQALLYRIHLQQKKHLC